MPEKNPTFQGYRIKTSVMFWEPADPNLSLFKILNALAMGVPVVIGHAITKAWDDAPLTAGFLKYKASDTNRGGHGVYVAGFILNEKLQALMPSAPLGEGGGYLIIKNSWSTCWGDAGYVYVPFQSVKEYTPDASVLWDIQ